MTLAVLQSESAGLGLQVDHGGFKLMGKWFFALEQQFKQQYNER